MTSGTACDRGHGAEIVLDHYRSGTRTVHETGWAWIPCACRRLRPMRAVRHRHSDAGVSIMDAMLRKNGRSTTVKQACRDLQYVMLGTAVTRCDIIHRMRRSVRRYSII